jgi:hypothetical protein
MLGQLECNAQPGNQLGDLVNHGADVHVQTEESHPSSSISLSEGSTSRQWLGSIERSNVIKTKETTFKDIVSIGILPVYPPVCQLNFSYQTGQLTK